MRRGIVLVVLALAASDARANGSLGGEYWGPGQVAGGRPARVAANLPDDALACWPYWFEREKEALLAERLRARRAAAGLNREELAQESVPVLIRLLSHESEWVRATAVRALGQWGGAEVVIPLRGRLVDPQPDVREQTCLALGLTGAPDAGEILRGILADPKQPDLHPWAALGLGLLRDERAEDSMDSPLVSSLAARSDRLGRAPGPAAAIALGAIGKEFAVDALGSRLLPRSGGVELKAAVCQALGRIGGFHAHTWLLRSFYDREPSVRAAAARALGAFPEKRTVVLLHRGCRDGDRMTGLYSLLSLGRCLPAAESDSVRDTVRTELVDAATRPAKDVYACQYAAFALALAGDHAADDFLLEILDRESRERYATVVHTAAAMSLGFLTVPEAAPLLRDFLADNRFSGDARGYAAFALGLLGDPAAAAAIRAAMDDADAPPELRRSAAWALGLVGDDSDVPRLVALLRRENAGPQSGTVRFAAARALGILGSEAAVAPLLEMARESEVAADRAFAIRALGFLLDRSPVDRVPGLLSGLDHRNEAWIVREVRGLR